MSRRSRLFVSTQVKDWGKSSLARIPDTNLLLQGADLWLDASDTLTITASSGDVSQWSNKGKLGNFTQATGAVQPKTGVTTLNGLNVVDFSSDYLTAVNKNQWKFLHDGTNYLICWVAKFGTTTNPATQYPIIGNNGGSSSSHGLCIYYEDASPNNDALGFFLTNASGNAATAPVRVTDSDELTPNTFQVFSSFCDADNSTASNRLEFYINGGSKKNPNIGAGVPSSSDPTYTLQIGTFGNDSAERMVGSIAEIVIVSGDNATEANRIAIRDYLNQKWRIY